MVKRGKHPGIANMISRNDQGHYRSKNDCYKPRNHGSIFPAVEHNQKRVSSLESNEENAENHEGNTQQDPIP